jgi:hypothetical protein
MQSIINKSPLGDLGVKELIPLLSFMIISLLVIDELFFIVFLNDLNSLPFLARELFKISTADSKTAETTRRNSQ